MTIAVVGWTYLGVSESVLAGGLIGLAVALARTRERLSWLEGAVSTMNAADSPEPSSQEPI
jgi:hypothetical protein